VTNRPETYAYNAAESEFYGKLTEFIVSGRAFASTLDSSMQRAVILVLITMQKLASSSVAAIRHALSGRLVRLRTSETEYGDREERRRHLWRELQELEASGDPADDDRRARLEEQMAEVAHAVRLNVNEIPALEELLRLADAIKSETKIGRVLDVIEDRFAGKSVLLFTEYKATQALVVSKLRRRYGADSVTFINGDGYLEGVRDDGDKPVRLEVRREDAADAFNGGRARFLVSTEAAGEGVDLQHRCASLIHVDLPWNPMRLHQRVGRVSRYGQHLPVDVVTLHNPSTVEARIWECLNEKLARITEAFRTAMDDPEDMLQVVLGMASSATYERIFGEAEAHRERLQEWFDLETATLGGRDVVELVKEMFGNVARFDFGTSSKDLPRVDLPDLIPFLKAALVHWGRRPDQGDLSLSFLTPEAWRQREVLLAEKYELHFSREGPDSSLRNLGGVGHRVVDVGLALAADLEECVALLGDRDTPVLVFRIRDQVTETPAGLRAGIIAAVEGWDSTFRLLRDWEVIGVLNRLLDRPQAIVRAAGSSSGSQPERLDTHVAAATAWLTDHIGGLDLELRLPEADILTVIWPMSPAPSGGTP
jgi:hypothetical protein